MRGTNLPTLLTLSRFFAALLLPAAFLLFDRPAADMAALLLFIFAALTDIADGQIARRFGLETPLGAALDSVADKALVMISLALLLAYFSRSEWLLIPVCVIFVRELLIAGLREQFSGKGMPLSVTSAGKWKSACQMLAIALLFCNGAVSDSYKLLAAAGILVLWLAAGLTFYSGMDYVKKAIRQLGQ